MTAPADRLSAPAGTQAFSRPLVVDDVPDAGLDETIEANAAECAAVAEEIGLPAVRHLAARFDIARRPGGRVQVTGMVEATVTQECVVSLEPFDGTLTQAIDVTFAPEPTRERPASGRPTYTASRRRQRPEARDAPPPPARVVEGEDDPPDLMIDGRIDLGAIAVEFLTLALDFYPRKPGVHFSDVVGEPGDDKPSAFAALARLKDRP